MTANLIEAHPSPFDELGPVGPTRTAAPRLGDIPDVMFVIEPEQAARDGRLWLANVALQR